MYTLTIDCKPGSLRPCDLLLKVLDGTGLCVDDFERPVSTFGEWVWSVKATSTEAYENSRTSIGEALKQMREIGLIRYAGW